MLIDTSTLLRTAQASHPQRETARSAIKALTARGEEIQIVPQNLFAMWVVATRAASQNGLGMSVNEAAAELAPAEKHVPFGKPAHDARLVASMQAHGLTSILTFDRTGFSRYAGIDVVHPTDLVT